MSSSNAAVLGATRPLRGMASSLYMADENAPTLPYGRLSSLWSAKAKADGSPNDWAGAHKVERQPSAASDAADNVTFNVRRPGTRRSWLRPLLLLGLAGALGTLAAVHGLTSRQYSPRTQQLLAAVEPAAVNVGADRPRAQPLVASGHGAVQGRAIRPVKPIGLLVGSSRGYLRLFCAKRFQPVIDGVLQGHWEPAHPMALSPGSHTVQLRYGGSGNLREMRQVTLEAGKTTSLHCAAR